MDFLEDHHLAIALEPIHIGARVPGSLARTIAKTSDGLPMLPASSLKGCARALSHVDFSVHGCDGKGRECPQPHRCASCAVYGYANYHDSAVSLVRFSSGELILAPWSADRKPVWLTTLDRLRSASLLDDATAATLREPEAGQVLLSKGLDPDHFLTKLAAEFGLQAPPEYSLMPRVERRLPPRLRDVGNRLIVLDEESFLCMGRSALSVSASIALESQSKIARPGALFATEAVAKSAVFSFSVLYAGPSTRGAGSFLSDVGNRFYEIPPTIAGLKAIVWAGLSRFEVFGVGGRRSRGFGRLRVFESHETRGSAPRDLPPIMTAGKERPRAFISYVRQDAAFARRLVGALQKEGVVSWLDLNEILVGDSIANKTREGIESSQYVVVVLSKHSTECNWVESQLDLALSLETSGRVRRVLPAVIDDAGHNLPMRLIGRATADFSSGFSAGVADLARSIAATNRQ